MLVGSQQKLQDDIRALVQRHGRTRDALLPILQDLQAKHACVPDFAMQVVADELGLHPAEVYGVVSFYAFLGHEPRGRFVVRLCRTVSCELARTAPVARQLENELGIAFGETTRDGRFSLEWAACLGLCDQGPALLVNDRVYTKVTPERVHAIVEDCRRVFGAHAAQTEPAAHAAQPALAAEGGVTP
ncbi:MAG: NAD(P)H-dependent oxidoreductase subunit E [Candidatus Eisenbacteria bacterium]|uniref:NAD(P)H-dependent oxidoreductase subunit E n=1 Tax=Eiseniibacteriota bacterium TaxID=2212470 RepID=A0A933W9J5_UNCEI|nr:NAD(P)H-dependent oxidoreductase subunit E [Candidatus Eisenbacteria bacterium]